MIHFHHTLSETELSEVRAVYFARTRLSRVAFALLGLCFAALALWVVVDPRSTQPAKDGMFLGAVAVILVAFAAFLPRLHWATWRRQYSPLLLEHPEGLLSDRGLHIPASEEPAHWEHIVAAKVSSSVLLLYINRSFCFALHSRMFSSPDAWHAATALVRHHLAGRIREVNDGAA